MGGVTERALDRGLPVPVRAEPVRYLGEQRKLTGLVTLVQIAQRQDEVDEVSTERARDRRHPERRVRFDEFELRDMSRKAGEAIVKGWREW